MTHPKHNSTPKGKRRNGTTPKRKMPIGLRSAKQIRDNRKSAVIVPVVERPWLVGLVIGEVIRMPINFRGKGFIDIKVTGACFHATLESIPLCKLEHSSTDFDAQADWNRVLLKAAWGSNRPAPTAEMKERARQGWFVLDFEPTAFPKEWQARAKNRRTVNEGMSHLSGDTGHASQV